MAHLREDRPPMYLPKSERLYLRDELHQLFSQGASMMVYPIRVVYLVRDKSHVAELDSSFGNIGAGHQSVQADVAVVVVVAKKRFKHASDRNRIKRLTRESYRQRKAPLLSWAEEHQVEVRIALQSVAREMPDFRMIDRAMERLIAKLLQKFEGTLEKPSRAMATLDEVVAMSSLQDESIVSGGTLSLGDDTYSGVSSSSSSVGIAPSEERKRLSCIVRLALLPIHIYRYAISPLFPPSCRFTPTCSQYGIEAIRTHGVLRGTCLTIWRILRCNPWNKHVGYDPVPPRRDGMGSSSELPHRPF